MRVQILITNKVGVFDPEGKVIETGLQNLGHTDVKHAAVGKLITLELDTDNEEEARKSVDTMCAEFLVNPVLERYEMKVLS